MTTKTTLNKRFPPLADRTSLPHRLTGLSRQKLAREATAPDPDVRRCLAHFRLHVASMEWTSKDVRSQISSVELEEEEDDEDEDANQKARELEERLSRQSGADVKKKEEKSDESQPQPQQSSPAPDVVRVSFHVQRPASNDDESVQQEQPQHQQEQPQQQEQQPPSPPRKDDGIIERSRSCLEKTGQKHFWLSSGQCVPVRIAS